MKHWYVLQVKSNHESRAVLDLSEQGFKTFHPTYISTSKHPKSGRLIRRILSLFPSYIFIEFDFDADNGWRNVLTSKGVIKPVGFGETSATAIPTKCIEELMARVQDTGHIDLEAAVIDLLEFSPGMKVMIKSGPLEGNIATYCNHKGNRVILLMTLLSQPVKLLLNESAIGTIPKDL